ncbi:hypothetical protein Lal_00007346 [Lupinus albus]|nr:hypothetical protein Lal_00007346 [Lupinus albus]
MNNKKSQFSAYRIRVASEKLTKKNEQNGGLRNLNKKEEEKKKTAKMIIGFHLHKGNRGSYHQMLRLVGEVNLIRSL